MTLSLRLSGLFFLATVFLSTACNPVKRLHKTQLQYFPDKIHDVYFGMSETDFLDARPDAERVEQEFDFRNIYIETFDNPASEITDIVYYINTGEPNVLYEIILIYQTEEARNVVAANLLGTPNYENGTEWIYDSGEGFRINAWTYQNKLIYAGKIDGTEWEEE